MSDEAAKILASGFTVGCAFIMFGLFVSSPSKRDFSGLSSAINSLSYSQPHAACIEKGRSWNDYYKSCDI